MSSITLHFERETKAFWLYKARGRAVVQDIYLRKESFEKPPASVKLTVEESFEK